MELDDKYGSRAREVRPQATVSVFIPALAADYLDRVAKEKRLRRDLLVGQIWDVGYAGFCAGQNGAPPPEAPALQEHCGSGVDPSEIAALRAKVLEIGKAVAAKDQALESLRRRAESLSTELATEKQRGQKAAKETASRAKALEQQSKEKMQALYDLDAAKQQIARVKAKADEDMAMARNALALASAEVLVLRDQLAVATAKPRVDNPDAKPTVTPQQEADGLSRSMVAQAKSLYLRDEPLAAIARWAEVSTAAMRIVLKLKTSKASA